MTHSLIKHLRRGVFGLAVLGLVACEDQGVTPLASEADSPTVVFDGGRHLLGFLEEEEDDAAEVELVKLARGATLTLDDVDLLVRPGSISPDIEITIEPLDEEIVGFKFGPNGLLFDPAATLIISADKANLRGIDPSRLAIAGASDDVDDWEVIGGVYDPLTNSVVVPILHFSRYAMCIR